MSSATEAPQCSTLRRHWEAAKAMESQSSNPKSQDSNNSSGGGFFGWLKSLFS